MATVANIAASQAGYVWEDPGDSIMIQVNLDVIERLGSAVQQGLGGSARGNEIGGILLGRTLPGLGRAVVVEDFELVSSEHLRGASYTLSPKDRRVLGARLSRRPAQQVVGYFRSHTRPGMYLDQDDFLAFSQYFPEAWQVFLLVRPSADGTATGGFFFWEDGDINRRSTYRQFPFDVAGLATGGYPITGEQAPPVMAPRPMLVPPATVPKAEVREARHLPLPSLPWVVVPIIAVLFLIAGIFVSENQTPTRAVVAGPKATPAVEPLLPEPTPVAINREPEVNVPAPETLAPAQPAQPAKPIKPVKVKKVLPQVAAPVTVAVEHTPARPVDPPPALAAPMERIEPKVAAVLPVHVQAAPPLEAEVSYEAPQPGVFKRAFRKIEGGNPAFVPASPIRKVLPVKPAGDAEARPVDVKVFIDEAGNVSKVQALTKGSDLASAALNAARQWQFTPARKHDKPVSSEMVLHFHF